MTFSTKFFGGRRLPLVLQSEAAECGLACLAMIARSHGRDTTLVELRQGHAAGRRGATVHQLMRAAESLQLAANPVRLDVDEIDELRVPCVLHWNLDHFVVLERVRRNSVLILDPAVGRRRVHRRELSVAFSGVALELMPAADFTRGSEQDRLRLTDLLRGSRGLGRSLFIMLVLSLTLQALALLLPFYSQLVIDDVILRGDSDLLRLLAAAFLLLVFMQTVFGMSRAWLIVALTTRLTLEWGSRVFRHLLRLPLSYFEHRQIGDIQSRFASLATLQQLLTRQLVEALVDGLMAVMTLAVMFFYHPTLTLLVLVSILIYLLARLSLFLPMQSAAQEALVATASRESCFLESLRGVLAIKCAGVEAERQGLYLRRAVAASCAQVRASRLGVWQLGMSRFLFGTQMVLVIWFGAVAIMGGEMTVGMLVAFLAYRALLTERSAALIDRVFELRIGCVHLERLSDIVCTALEPVSNAPTAMPRSSRALTVAAQHLSYRHAGDDDLLLSDVNLQLRSGEHVVITGPSGAGKTTLLKLLMGLLQPTAGVVRVNSQALTHFGLQRYRQHIAAVMQEDQLFSGSLLDNITMFSAQPDRDWCKRCAWLAAIDDLIEALPLGYFTPVGDMGSALSGGQRQRLLLARALYRRPDILFLDEFTSHLDPASERVVNERLATLSMTRVVVAHRRETVACADRQIHLPALLASGA